MILTLGRRGRQVVIAREAFPALRAACPELSFHPAGDGQVSDDAARLASTWQTWGLDGTVGLWRIDVMREPWSEEDWVYRRDARIRRPLNDAIAVDAHGIPYLAPEIVLLFKAKRTSETDERDLAAALPGMDARQRAWLAAALELERPGHAWLSRL